jgi:hypothetical protein
VIRSLLICVLLFCALRPAQAERLWLVIGSSDSSAAGIALKAKPLSPGFQHSLIVQTTDCGDQKAVFAWVAEAAVSPEAAQAVLSRVREAVKDAYVKVCDVRPHTLLAFRVSAVDASIADVPRDSVNWQEKDRISAIQPLPDGRAVVIARYFFNDEGPLEGRGERVLLVEPSEKRRTLLEASCMDSGAIASQANGRIAFQCGREAAADFLLHSVLVFDAAGKKLVEVQRCSRPTWSSDRVIACKEESIDSNGRLKLRAKRIELPS